MNDLDPDSLIDEPAHPRPDAHEHLLAQGYKCEWQPHPLARWVYRITEVTTVLVGIDGRIRGPEHVTY